MRDHSDIVKGLSWDPLGKMLATQSDDKTVKFWATNTWQCVKTIEEPFQEVFLLSVKLPPI